MKANKVLMINLILLISMNFVLAQTSTLKPVQKNEKWGFADDQGNIVIACEYEKVDSFKNGFAVVYNDCVIVKRIIKKYVYRTECVYKLGVINTQGKIIIPIKYGIIEDFNEYGIAKVYCDSWRNRNENIGYFDKTGKEILPCSYLEGDLLRIGDFRMLEDNQKFGLINKEYKVVIPVCYDEIKPTDKYYYHEDIPAWAVIQIRLGDKWGFYNPINNMLVEPQFDMIYRHPGYNIDETEQFLFTKTGNDIWVLEKATGKKVLFLKYDKINSLWTDKNTNHLDQFFNKSDK